jgi:hypothetical protein
VEYVRSATAGHEQVINWVALPADALDKPYVQLLWRYYCTDPIPTGARDELRLDDITVQTCSNPLPVTLISFNANVVEEKVLLTWTTIEERNSDYFDVERSQDARSWTSIGRITGKGTVTTLNEYRLEDPLPLAGTSYYRLKQVDTDHLYTYSHIIPVQRPRFAVSIFPNPADHILYIKVANQKDRFSYIISDVSGQVRLRSYAAPGRSSIPVGGLSSGLYLIRIHNNDGTATSLKFMKK